MIRSASLIVVVGLLVLPGCVNRSATGPFGVSARVAPPETYSLRIPSLANNQPYYTPDQNTQVAANPPQTMGTVNPSSPINPNGPAPTAASRNPDGWRLVGSQPIVSNVPSYQSPYVVANREAVPATNYQIASGTTLTNRSMVNQNNQPNLNQLDSTRMAAIDVSGVRPPVATSPIPATSQPAILPQRLADQPRQYLGQFQTHPRTDPAMLNTNGFTQPQFQNRYAAESGVGLPGGYRSPHIRQGVVQGSFDNRVNSQGWVARGSSASSR